MVVMGANVRLVSQWVAELGRTSMPRVCRRVGDQSMGYVLNATGWCVMPDCGLKV